jgi:hypothetical protein
VTHRPHSRNSRTRRARGFLGLRSIHRAGGRCVISCGFVCRTAGGHGAFDPRASEASTAGQATPLTVGGDGASAWTGGAHGRGGGGGGGAGGRRHQSRRSARRRPLHHGTTGRWVVGDRSSVLCVYPWAAWPAPPRARGCTPSGVNECTQFHTGWRGTSSCEQSWHRDSLRP